VSTGILFNAAGTLNIQNCVIRGFGANDVSFFPNGSATFNITDTIVTLSGPAPPEPSMLKPSRAASIAWTGLNVPVTVPENLGSTETASKPILETIARHLAGG
jgi:hypothetical protein